MVLAKNMQILLNCFACHKQFDWPKMVIIICFSFNFIFKEKEREIQIQKKT